MSRRSEHPAAVEPAREPLLDDADQLDPRSNKVFLRGVGVIARLEQLEYSDGEDDESSLGGGQPGKRSG